MGDSGFGALRMLEFANSKVLGFWVQGLKFIEL